MKVFMKNFLTKPKDFSKLVIGDPFDRKTQVGPLISETSFNAMQSKLDSCKEKSLKIFGGDRLDLDDAYVTPAILKQLST